MKLELTFILLVQIKARLLWVEKPITFFGDSMQLGGNDYPLARALEKYKDCKSIQVKDWKDTFEILTGEKV